MDEQEYNDFIGNEIAIIGMACRVPGAQTAMQFWENVRNGVESIRPYTDEELRSVRVSEKLINHPNYVKRGASLENMEMFDPKFFNMRPREAQVMDPQHRHFLECAWEALEDATYDPAEFDGQIGVFGGSGHNIYFSYNVLTNQALMDSEGFFLLRHTGNDKDFLTTRVSYAFNLKGPSVNVQTACSTSLVAIHMATQSLNQMECDMALAGGVTIELPHRQGYVYQENEILSPDGHCRAFSADSEGTVFGSGVGVVVLRRLEDALRDNDPILGVVLSTAINNDGSDKASYLAPSPEGQALAISEALQVAEIDADTITYVETHGTGTKLGDPIEIQGLTQAFRHSTSEKQFCGIGSVKTNIGHLDTAAGVLSFIKAVQALRHKQLPPSLNFDKPNPMIDFENSPFYVNDQLKEWEDPVEFPRRAGVSSLGVGGTNAHVLLQEAPERSLSAPSQRRYQLLTLSGLTATSLDGNTGRMAEFLDANRDINLADVGFTTQVGRRAFKQRRVVVGQHIDDMVSALETKDRHSLATLIASDEEPEVVFMFPGGGAQYPGMGQDLYEQEPLYRQVIDECFSILQGKLDVDLKSLMFAEPDMAADAAVQLQRPLLSLPAIFMTEYALAQLWQSWGIEPQAMIGHSMGEYTAACLAGVLSLRDALSIVTLRGQLFETLPDGGMISVSLPEAEIRELLVDGASIAVINNPEICVVSGEVAAIEQMKATLDEVGASYRPIPIKVAAHSPMLEPILERFEAHMRTIHFNAPKIRYVSNVTGRWITPGEAMDPMYWVKHLRHTVRYADGLTTLLSDSSQLFLEVGPGQVLSSLLRAHPDKSIRHAAVPSMRHFRETTPDDQHLLLAFGQAWAAGLKIDWSKYYGDEIRQRIHIPTYSFDHDRYWIDPGKQLFTAEPSSRDSLTKQTDMADWYYRAEWRHDRLPPQRIKDDEHKIWLLFADELGLSELIQSELVGRRHTVFTVYVGDRYEQIDPQRFAIRPDRKDDYERLIQTLSERGQMPHHIAHCWTVFRAPDKAGLPSDIYRTVMRTGFSSLVYLMQAFGSVEHNETLTINVCTNGSQRIGREEIEFPEKSILAGPCRVIPREYPFVQTKLIDVRLPNDSRRNWLSALYDDQVPDSQTVPIEETARVLVQEMLIGDEESFIAFRDTGRWVMDVRPFPIRETAEVDNRLRQRGVYLITGGLGGIGLTLATHLASTYQAKLVLISRTRLPDRAEWPRWLQMHAPTHRTSFLIQQINQLEELGGEVLYVRADVTRPIDVEYAVQTAIDRFGSINGVIHAAGVIDDALIQMKDMALAERVLAPKVRGTFNLHDALAGLELDFMVLFSSTSTVLAPAGQVDYVAANAFLNSFAEARQGDNYGPLISLNWGVWQEVGMAAASLRGEAERIHGRDMPHPWLGQLVMESPQKLEYVMDYQVDDLWFLSEHRIKRGQALIPGTGYLELASGALAQEHVKTAVHIRDLFFLTPLSIADDETTRVRVSLIPQEFGADYTFVVGSEAQHGVVEHARGIVSSLHDKAPRALLVDQIKARCKKGYVFYAPLGQETKQEKYLDFGLRWKNLREIFLGDNESFARLELPSQFHDDTKTFMLHPALMDLATTHGLLLLDNYEADDGLYVPFLYHSLKAYAPVGTRIFSHIRLRQPASIDMPTFDITITDHHGRVLVEIEGFTMKRVLHAEMVSQQSKAMMKESDSGNSFLQKTIESGILPEEGILAFTDVLKYQAPPQIIVSSIELNSLRESMNVSRGDTALASSISVERPSNLSSEYAEPANEIERTLISYWESFIGVSPIGIHDDFFELGGHSLIAVRFFTRVKKQYKVDLSLATLFETPTVAQCALRIMNELGIDDSAADSIDQDSQPAGHLRDTWSPIVHINRGDLSKTPFFCIHGAGGNVLNFQALSQHVGQDRPFYGLQAQGVDGVLPPLRSVEQMADLYLPEIQRIQPHGPYLLGGYSGGGVVAYELAQRLNDRNEVVRLVAFLDTFHPTIESQRISIGDHWREMRTKGLDYIRDRLSKREKRQQTAEKTAASLAYVERHPEEVVPFEHREPYLVNSFIGAMNKYDPKPYAGRVVQFAASETWIMYKHVGDDRGWGSIIPQLEIQKTPGDHDTIVTEPNVQVLAAHLRAAIES